MVYTHTKDYLAICTNEDELAEHFATYNKTEKQTLYKISPLCGSFS